MRWRTRCGYLSGLFYYVHTAIFTFAAQSIPLILLTFMPQEVRLANYGLLLPSILYSTVIFPAWNRGRYGLEAFAVKLLYGWSHLFAIWDICSRKQLGWQATGSSKRKSGTCRVWLRIAVWNGGTGLAWVALATWRVALNGATFIPLLLMGLSACLVTAVALGTRRNHARLEEAFQRGAESLSPASVLPPAGSRPWSGITTHRSDSIRPIADTPASRGAGSRPRQRSGSATAGSYKLKRSLYSGRRP